MIGAIKILVSIYIKNCFVRLIEGKRMFCKHKWELLSETVTKSRAQLFRDLGGSSIKHADSDFFNTKHIQTFTCDKCGGFKRFVEKI